MRWWRLRNIFVAATVLALGIFCAPPAAAQCVSVDHGADDQAALNGFWGTRIPMCQIPPGSNNAYADRARGIVFVDQDWLDEIAERRGSWAATGILAHEWGHMVQGNVGGTAAELQADCLAGVFMRGAGLSADKIDQFAQQNLLAGDAEFSFGGHGLGPQRYNAAMRGYVGFGSFNGGNLLAICPFSAF